MRVLDTYSGQFVNIDLKTSDPRVVQESLDPSEVKYAILSHTWDAKEQSYQELLDIQQRYVARNQQSQNCNSPKRVHWWGWITQLVKLIPSVFRPHSSDQGDSLSTDTLPQPSHISQPTASPETLQSTPPDTTSSEPPLSPIWDDVELSPKILEACRVARKHGYRYIWIDSCCIDKTSSSELSESINSMYQWYARSDVCYAFLPDVPAEEDHRSEGSRFRSSRWFKRGWTLQELIAPVEVVFLSQDWKFIGSKESLAGLVTEITNISYNALLHIEPLDEFSVAQRLSWAAERTTTRVEDRAYSLLGIFGINMPTLYGEGDRAFRRLQEEIMRRTPDQSLFAWTWNGVPFPPSQLYDTENAYTKPQRLLFQDITAYKRLSLLAPSLDLFDACADIEAIPHDELTRLLQLNPDQFPATDYDFTPYGIRMRLPVVSFSSSPYFPPGSVLNEFSVGVPFPLWHLVILGCRHKEFSGHLLGRICYQSSSEYGIEFSYCGCIIDTTMHGSVKPGFDLLPVSPTTLKRLYPSHIALKTVHIPHPDRDEAMHNVARRMPHEAIKFILSKKTCEALSARGYAIDLRSPDQLHPATHSVTLSHSTHTIVIDYQHTLEERGHGYQTLTIEALVKTSDSIAPVQGPGGVRSDVDRLVNAGVVSWSDSVRWGLVLSEKEVKLTIPGEPMMQLTMELYITFATKNHYLLHIDLKTAGPNPSLHLTAGTPTGSPHHALEHAGGEVTPSIQGIVARV